MTTREYCSGYRPSLVEFKRHIRMTSNAMDDDLELKLKAAVNAAEHHIGQYIALSDITVSTNFVHELKLRGPVASVVSVKVDGELVSPDLYRLRGGRVVMDESVNGEDLMIVYRAGCEDVPADVTAAILLKAASLFNNPVDSVETLTTASQNLLRPYRHWELDGE